MSNIPNRQAICDVLCRAAETDKDIVVLCSDSRGSASLAPFADRFPDQFVEVGIAEQNLISIAAGMARCGKKSWAASPASFVSTRSYEQVKVDCAYSNTNVKIIGISGGVSYGALGMTHHSAQDIAAMCAIPGLSVYLPSDHFQTAKLVEALLTIEDPAYLRVGRNAVPDVYSEEDCPFELNKANILRTGGDACIIACGELVAPSVQAADTLLQENIHVAVVDMYCLKPLDTKTLLDVAGNAKIVFTAEEHSPYGGLGAQVAQAVAASCPRPVHSLALPDAPVITGNSAQVFEHYGLNAAGIAEAVRKELNRWKSAS
ncbi:MAG: transketolase family protein [Clostridia bacterium]|nr:transketolase family protein [Clostridia bacterium]